MKNIKINNVNYEVVKDYKDSFNSEELLEKFTDYFEEYDVGYLMLVYHIIL